MQAEMVEAEALRRSDELKTALLRSISHDLRTPLTSIIAGGAALGSPSTTGDEREELSEAVVAEGERLSRLVENLLDMSRLEAGKARAAPGAGRPRRGARGRPRTRSAHSRGGAAGARPRAAARRRRRRPSSSEPSPTCSRTRFGHGGGRPVLVSSRLVGDKIGRARGRPGPRNPRERAASGSSSRSTHGEGGSGGGAGPRAGDRQGLRRGQRRRDRGRVAARPGQQLRRHDARARERGVSERPRVLVCDDEPQILRALKVILRDAGYEAVPAASGEEALDQAAVKPPGRRDRRPDAARHRRRRGDQAAARVERDADHRALRGWRGGGKVRALAAGADDYVTKPFGPRELIARLQAALRRAPGRRGGADDRRR